MAVSKQETTCNAARGARINSSNQPRHPFANGLLGLKLVSAFPIDEGRALHTFFQMDDGSCLAFFEVPGKPFDFKRQDSLDLHIALGVDNDVFERMLQKGRARAIEVRGPVDHGFCRSIYFRDPNGYVIELTSKTPRHDTMMDPARNEARAILDRWQKEKAEA
jgi:catechol 2,3-dioxygenase-like lactoylglutathione lyase family enzyme